MDEAVRLMRLTFEALGRGEAQNQPRRRLILKTGSVLHSMAGAYGGYFGTKVYSAHAKYGAHFLFLLYDSETAKPLARMEANYLGQIRTGAASGFATDLLARPDARSLGIIGSGFQARSQLDSIRAVRKLGEVKVWSRSTEKREAFAAETGARAVSTAEEACDADIVATATWSKDPVLEDAWIRPGTHVNAMGSNNAQRRELPAELVHRADLIAVDSIEQAKIEAGDLLLACPPEEWKNLRLVELSDLAVKPREQKSNAITIFKSLGLGVEDVAAGAFVYEQALKRNYS